MRPTQRFLALFIVASALPCAAEVFLSEDAGKTWTEAGLIGKQVDEIIVDPKDPGVVYALVGKDVMNRREIHRSGDGGKHWIPLEPGVSPNCLGIDPDHPGMLWVGGDAGAYATSPDSGKSWEQGSIGDACRGTLIINGEAPKGNVRGFTFLGGSVIAVGGQGTGFIARSEDGGQTWERVSCKLGYAWACATGKGTVLVGGDSGLLASLDGGKTFTSQGSLQEQPGVGGRFSLAPDDLRIVFSFRGTTVSSSDGGKIWNSVPAPPGCFIDSVAWAGTRLVATAATGKLTKDGQMTFFTPDGGKRLLCSEDMKRWSELQDSPEGTPGVVAGCRAGKRIWLGTR